jgi:hypothetical protein
MMNYELKKDDSIFANIKNGLKFKRSYHDALLQIKIVRRASTPINLTIQVGLHEDSMPQLEVRKFRHIVPD